MGANWRANMMPARHHHPPPPLPAHIENWSVKSHHHHQQHQHRLPTPQQQQQQQQQAAQDQQQQGGFIRSNWAPVRQVRPSRAPNLQ